MANWMQMHPVWGGVIGGVFITLLNLVGALIVLLWPRPSQKVMDASLGFAAGVMLTASFTSLILPGIQYGGVVPVILGILLGAGVMDLADHFFPHEHAIRGREGRDLKRIRGIWLFIIAITLHNFPEGLAVGVGFGSGHFREGLTLALAIGIQNIPEGLSVALSALSLGYGRTFYAVWTGIRSGLVEIPAAFLGAVAVHFMRPLLPYAMGFAAGAMIYVVSDEIVPETHRTGHERLATFGTIIGAVVMLYLDVVLGA